MCIRSPNKFKNFFFYIENINPVWSFDNKENNVEICFLFNLDNNVNLENCNFFFCLHQEENWNKEMYFYNSVVCGAKICNHLSFEKLLIWKCQQVAAKIISRYDCDELFIGKLCRFFITKCCKLISMINSMALSAFWGHWTNYCTSEIDFIKSCNNRHMYIFDIVFYL